MGIFESGFGGLRIQDFKERSSLKRSGCSV